MNSIGKNGLGFKYFDNNNLLCIAAYPRVGKTDEFAFYFLRPMGAHPTDKIIELSDQIRTLGIDLPIYVKKIFKDQRDLLLKSGFQKIETFPWHRACIAEDDTYPEIVIEPKTTVEELKKKSKNHSLWHSFRNAQKLKRGHEVQITGKDFDKHAMNIAKAFFAQVDRKRTDKKYLSTELDYYNMIYKNPDREGLTKMLVYVDNKPLGFYVTEETKDKQYTNIYAHIILRHKMKRLSDYVLFDIIQNAKTPFINMGGSEDKGLDKFKRKFVPVEEISMHWAARIN